MQEDCFISPQYFFVLLSGPYIGGKCRLFFKGGHKDEKNIFARRYVLYRFGPGGIGSEQEGYRPVLIIQNNTGNKHSPTVIVAAISGKVETKPNFPVHCQLQAECGLELPSLVLLEQLRTIDKQRLETYIGRLEERRIRQRDSLLQ